jgi:tetratricopeptide (TPR) repeat protein
MARFSSGARDMRDAITLYAQALARTPDEPALTAARKRAQTRGTPPAAASLLEGPADPLVNLAALLTGDHQPEIALGYLRLALRLDPSRTDAWVLAGETLAQLGDATGSRAAYLQVNADGRPTRQRGSGWRSVSSRSATAPKALKIVRDALTAAPGDVETEVVYAELLRDAERHDEAIQILSGIIARNRRRRPSIADQDHPARGERGTIRQVGGGRGRPESSADCRRTRPTS